MRSGTSRPCSEVFLEIAVVKSVRWKHIRHPGLSSPLELSCCFTFVLCPHISWWSWDCDVVEPPRCTDEYTVTSDNYLNIQSWEHPGMMEVQVRVGGLLGILASQKEGSIKKRKKSRKTTLTLKGSIIQKRESDSETLNLTSCIKATEEREETKPW